MGMTAQRYFSTHSRARCRRIAAGILAGEALAAIARQEGVARQTIWKQVKSEEVQQIVISIVNGEIEELRRIFSKMLHALGAAFEARVIRIGKDGKPVDLGPDHYVRLAAAERLLQVLTAGRSIPKASRR